MKNKSNQPCIFQVELLREASVYFWKSIFNGNEIFLELNYSLLSMVLLIFHYHWSFVILASYIVRPATVKNVQKSQYKTKYTIIKMY